MKVKGEAVKPLSPEASVTQPENVHRVPWNRETFLKTHTHTHTHTLTVVVVSQCCVSSMLICFF